tara:strand:- start:785 stop:2467 length:1683 start_codon:yes stop_codon:yes gene_type:complete
MNHNYHLPITRFFKIGLISSLIFSSGEVFTSQESYRIPEEKRDNELELIKLGRDYEAIKLLENKIIEDPKNVYLFYLLGRAYKNLKQLEISEDYFKQAINLDPSYPKTYLSYALLKGKKGQIKEAIKLLDKAIELNPSYAKAFSNRGVAKGALSDNLGAIEDFNAAINLDPFLADAYRNRGITNELIGNLKGACKDWNIATSLGQNQTKDWFKDQCNDIEELNDKEKKDIISSLEITNERLRTEIQTLKNSSKLLNEISIGNFREPSNQKIDNEIDNISINYKTDIESSTNQDVLFDDSTKISLDDIKDKTKEINNQEISSLNSSEDLLKTNNISKNINKLTTNSFTEKSIKNDGLSIEDYNNLKENNKILSKEILNNTNLNNNNFYENKTNQSVEISSNKFENDSIKNFIFFAFGLISSGLFLKFISIYEIRKKSNENLNNLKIKENNNLDLQKEYLNTQLSIKQKTMILNKLIEEKKIIEERIKSIKYDLDYFKVKESNLKVYTLSKYKELFNTETTNSTSKDNYINSFIINEKQFLDKNTNFSFLNQFNHLKFTKDI